MTSHSLADLLPANVFAVLLVFCRIGAALQFLPGFSAAYVPTRIRLALGATIAFIATPLLAAALPPLPASVAGMAALIGAELLIGAFLGLYANLLVSALETAGGIIAMQSSLASAIVFNPGEEKSETVPAQFLSSIAVILIFATDLHHMLIGAVIDSYTSFPAGAVLPFADMADAVSRVVAKGFEIAIQISAPYLVLGTLFYVALGLIGRIMPQLQIFYVGLPLQIIGGLGMLLITIPGSMIFFLGQFQDLYSALLRFR